MESFPAMNPNPVLRVEKDGTVLYSNAAGEPLLHEWGVIVGGNLPSYIIDFVQKVISQNIPERIEVKAGSRVYLVSFHPLPKEDCVNIYGFDISNQKETETRLSEAYEQIQMQSEELEVSNEELRVQSEELQKANKALRKSEEKYRNLIETANEGIWIHDAEARTTYVNGKMAEMLGYSQEEMIDRFIWDFISEGSKATAKLNLEKRRLGISESFELKLICKDGSFLWALISAKTLLDKGGKFAGTLSMLTDITERKWTYTTLQENESRFRNLFKVISSGVAIYDVIDDGQDFIFKDMNPAGERIVHVQLENIIGKSLYDFFPNVDKMGLYEVFKRVWLTRKPEFVPVTLYEDGNIAVWLTNHVFRLHSGELVAVFDDITERKEAEEALIRRENEYRTLAENSPDIIARFDRQKRHIYTNPAAAEPYGHSPEKIVGKTNSELGMDSELVQFWEGHYENVFTTSKPKTMEFQYTSPQSKKYYFNTRVVPEFFNGKVTSVLAISRDITDVKEVEAKLNETLDNLENLVKERTDELEEAYSSLKESENGLAEAQRMAHIGNWDWNLVTNKVYWSDETYRIFGLNPQEFGATYDAFLSYVNPEDRKYLENANKEALNGNIYDIDYRIRLDDGEERVVHSKREVIFDKKNIPVRMKGTVQDITESKKAEEKIQSLANVVASTGDAIMTKSLDGIITSWNKGAEQIYGYSAEEILGKNVSILEPDNLKGEIKQFYEKIKQGKKTQHYETSRLKKDGTIINCAILF